MQVKKESTVFTQLFGEHLDMVTAFQLCEMLGVLCLFSEKNTLSTTIFLESRFVQELPTVTQWG